MQRPFGAPAFFVSLLLGLPALATEPGAPMDCSDLELAPGLTCTEVRPPLEEVTLGRTLETAVDDEGRVLWVRDGAGEPVGPCGLTTLRRRALLVAFDATGSRTPLVTATDRCVDPTARYTEGVEATGLAFDPVRARLFLALRSSCGLHTVRPGCPYTGPAPSTFSETLSWVALIDGFTPLADVLPLPPLPAPLCSNGLDDDGDGRIDSADSNCKSDADNDESRP